MVEFIFIRVVTFTFISLLVHRNLMEQFVNSETDYGENVYQFSVGMEKMDTV